MLSLLRVQVQSLVGELRTHEPCRATNRKESFGDLVSEEAPHTRIPAPLNNLRDVDNAVKRPRASLEPS